MNNALKTETTAPAAVPARTPARKAAAARKVAPKPAAKPAAKTAVNAAAAGKPVKKAQAAKPAKVVKAAKAEKTVKAVKPAKVEKIEKAAKPVKAKLVRDSFTMPQADFDLVAVLKARAMGFKRVTKKSELLRAGLHALQALRDTALQRALDDLVPLKPGRPKNEA